MININNMLEYKENIKHLCLKNDGNNETINKISEDKFSVIWPKIRYDNRLIQRVWFTEEDAGSQQAHVRRAQAQIAARCWQEKRHTENLHGIAGIGPTTHNQQQPMEQTKTWEQK